MITRKPWWPRMVASTAGTEPQKRQKGPGAAQGAPPPTGAVWCCSAPGKAWVGGVDNVILRTGPAGPGSGEGRNLSVPGTAPEG